MKATGPIESNHRFKLFGPNSKKAAEALINSSGAVLKEYKINQIGISVNEEKHEKNLDDLRKITLEGYETKITHSKSEQIQHFIRGLLLLPLIYLYFVKSFWSTIRYYST